MPHLRRIVLTVVSLLSMFPTASLEAGSLSDLELTVLAAHTEGDYGTGVAADSQTLVFRLSGGDVLHYWVDVPLLRTLATDGGVLHTGLGPTPGRRRQGDGTVTPEPSGSGGAMGSGSQGHSGGAPEGSPTLDGTTTWTSGMGDLRLGFGGRLLGGGVRLYRLDADLAVKAPTADELDGLGTGKWDARLGLLGEYRFWSVTAFGGVGWSSLGDPEGVTLEDALDAYVGLESGPLAGRFLISGWLSGREEVVSGTGARTLLGFSFRTTGRIRWRGSLAVGLTDGSEDLSATFGMSTGVTSPVQGRGRLGR